MISLLKSFFWEPIKVTFLNIVRQKISIKVDIHSTVEEIVCSGAKTKNACYNVANLKRAI